MIPLIRWELSQRKKAIFWWAFIAVITVALLLAIYPSIRAQAAQLNKIVNSLPNGLRQLKNGDSDLGISSPVGYLNSQLFYITLPILLIILSVTRGSSLLGREEQSHTLELLLARPIKRSTLLAAKALSGIIEVLIVSVAATVTAVILANAVSMNISDVHLLVTCFYVFVFSLSFGAIAFALTAAGRVTKGASTAIAVAFGFGGYLFAGLSALSHSIEIPAKLFPYHYFAPDKILTGKPVTGLTIYLLGIFVFSSALAYFGFRRRDID